MSSYRCPVCKETFPSADEARKDMKVHDNLICNILSEFKRVELVKMIVDKMTSSEKRVWIEKAKA
jgi:hypothetical protein